MLFQSMAEFRKLKFSHRISAVFASGAFLVAPVSVHAQTVSVETELLQQLQQIIEQQQQQLDAQAGTIEELNARLGQLEQQATDTQAVAVQAQSDAEKAIDTVSSVSAAPGPVVTSGTDKVKLSVSGQINRAVNIANDGEDTEIYHVDNDTSNTRVRFVGTGQVTEDTTVGTTLEIAFSPNNSFDVSQDNETADDFTDIRKAEVSARNDSLGQISLGKGQAAADDTAEYDLSLVAGPIMYSGISDIVGGLQFTDGEALSGIAVADAFFNFDGNRQDRVRYDSPVFGPGAQLSLSAGSEDRYDAALNWGGDYGDWTGVDIGEFTTLGAVSIRDPGIDDVDWRLAGSFSALHNPSGISATVSAGMDSRDDDRDDPYNLYGKLGWDTSIFEMGPTGFGVDLTFGENINADGDEGVGVGLAAVQLIEDIGTEVYGQLRFFDLDSGGGEDLDSLFVATVGARIKF